MLNLSNLSSEHNVQFRSEDITFLLTEQDRVESSGLESLNQRLAQNKSKIKTNPASKNSLNVSKPQTKLVLQFDLMETWKHRWMYGFGNSRTRQLVKAKKSHRSYHSTSATIEKRPPSNRIERECGHFSCDAC